MPTLMHFVYANDSSYLKKINDCLARSQNISLKLICFTRARAVPDQLAWYMVGVH